MTAARNNDQPDLFGEPGMTTADNIRDWQARQEAAKDAYYRTSDDAKREKKRAYDARRYQERKANR